MFNQSKEEKVIEDFLKVVFKRKQGLFLGEKGKSNQEFQKKEIPLTVLDGIHTLNYNNNLTTLEEEKLEIISGGLAELFNLGYTLSEDLVKTLVFNHNIFPLEVVFYIENLINFGKEAKGDNVSHNVFYPNFPQEVKEMSHIGLYVNSIFHYWTYGRWIPNTEPHLREKIKEEIDLIEIKLVSDSIGGMIKEIVSSNTSLSQSDYNHLNIILEVVDQSLITGLSFLHEEDIEYKKRLLNVYYNEIFKLDIPFAETRAWMGARALKLADKINAFAKEKEFNIGINLGFVLQEYYVNTPTDLLRLATAISKVPEEDKDLSLAQDTKFVRIKRSHRRVILAQLNLLVESKGHKEVLGEMTRHKQKWLRLGEAIHPSEPKHAVSYELANYVYRSLRNNEKVETFNNKVEQLIEDLDKPNTIPFRTRLNQLTKLLQTRPTDFARRLDKILRSCNDVIDSSVVIKEFAEVSEEVSTPVLWQLISFFKDRKEKAEDDNAIRLFSPKGKTYKSFVTEDNRDLYPKHTYTCDNIKELCKTAIQKKIRNQISESEESLEESSWRYVYIDPNLKNHAIPKSQRSANESLKTWTRGTKVDLNDSKDILRLFVHWKNEFEFELCRTDVDLSVGLYNKDWELLDHVSYTNLTIKGITHSGDITNAPDGATEYIDIEFDEVLKHYDGLRYIIPSIYVYSGSNLKEIPECFLGWMYRENAQANELYEPKMVDNKVDLGTDSSTSIPVVIDLEEKQMTWLDIAVKTKHHFPKNIEANGNNIVTLVKALSEARYTNLYKVFKTHAYVKGIVLQSIDELNEKMEQEMQEIEELVNSDGVVAKEETVNEAKRIIKKKYKVFTANPEQVETEAEVISPQDINLIMSYFLK